MLGGIVTANFTTVITDLETYIHRGKGHNLFVYLFVKLSQKMHNKMPMLPSEETMLMTPAVKCLQ